LQLVELISSPILIVVQCSGCCAPQGRSHRHRARRVGRSEIAGRPTGAHPREDSGADLLSLRSRQPEAIEGCQGRAAELRCERADGQCASDAGTLHDLFRERPRSGALHANIMTSGEQASCVHPFASAPCTISATRRNRVWTCRACTPRSWSRWLCSTGSDSISCGSPSITSSMTATCLRGYRWRARSPRVQTCRAIERRLPAAVQPPGAAGRGPRGTRQYQQWPHRGRRRQGIPGSVGRSQRAASLARQLRSHPLEFSQAMSVDRPALAAGDGRTAKKGVSGGVQLVENHILSHL
jgi:hypothetical protein